MTSRICLLRMGWIWIPAQRPFAGPSKGGIAMANLKEEYTDIRDRTHSVEHVVVSAGDKADRERIVEELLYALTRTGKDIPA